MSLSASSPSPASSAAIVAEDLWLQADEQTRIYIANKRPAGMAAFTGARVLLLIHGATYPSVSFDTAFGDKSWMDVAAEAGFDVYRFDFPGYGRSTRPASLDQPPADNPPALQQAEASRYLSAVIDYIRQRRGVETLNLLGWCWGGKLAGIYATAFPHRVNRLVFYGMRRVEIEEKRAMPVLTDAWRPVTREDIAAIWSDGLTPEQFSDVAPPEHVASWLDAVFALDPAGAGRFIRVPNGPGYADLEKLDDPDRLKLFMPSKITCPVLVIRGAWDKTSTANMSKTVYEKLFNAVWKKYVTIPEATHFLFLEKNRFELYRQVTTFLTENGPPIPRSV